MGTTAQKLQAVVNSKNAVCASILASGGGVTDNVELEFLDAIPTGSTPATGGNAFLTGVFPGPNTSFEIKAQALNQTMTDSYHVEGALAANTECRWGVDQNLNGVRTNFGILTNMGGWASTYVFYTVAAGNGNYANFEYKSSNPAVYGYDSTTKTVYTQAVGFGARTSTVLPDQTSIGTFTKEFMLFGRPMNNTAISPTANITTRAARLYYAKFWESGVLTKHFVPYRKDGVICLWEKVSNTFVYNYGTGRLFAGPEKPVEGDWYPDYIQSNSACTVYIDLNSFVDTTNGTSYSGEIKWAPNNTTNDKWIFGDGRITKRVGVYGGGTPVKFTIHGLGSANVNGTTLGSVATLTDDGTTVTSTFTLASFKNMYLFRQYDPNNPAIIDAKLYYMKLWDANSNLAHHLVPVVHDGAVMVKDLVTGLYYGKVSGTYGTFAAPPPAKEMPDKFIDWQTASLNTSCADPEMDDVVFYNLDGTVCWHGTYKEAQRLSAMPTPKEIPGCTFQCWNWTIDDIQGLNEMAPWACIAPHYVTNDDKTHIKFTIDGTLNTRTVILSRLMCCSTDNQSSWSFTVDWGDGTVETFPQTARSTTGTTSHTYAADGKYEVTLDATCPFSLHNYNATNYSLFGGSTTANVRDPIGRMVTAFYTGSKLRNRTGSRQSNVSYLQNAEYIVIHKDYCTFPSNSGGFTNADGPEFSNNFRAKIVTVPRGPVHHHDYAFNGTWNVVNPCSPRTITRYEYYCLTACHGIKRIVVNPNTTTFSFGDMASQPNSVVRIDMPKCVYLNTSSERNKNWVWRWWCNAENSWNKYIGWCLRTGTGAITADAGWFQHCVKLKKAFIQVENASSFTLNANTFATCLSLQDIWFIVSAVPIINSNTTFYGLFNNTAPNCNISNLKIHVPKALYDDWKVATQWVVGANLLVPYEPGERPVFGEENEQYRT